MGNNDFCEEEISAYAEENVERAALEKVNEGLCELDEIQKDSSKCGEELKKTTENLVNEVEENVKRATALEKAKETKEALSMEIERLTEGCDKKFTETMKGAAGLVDSPLPTMSPADIVIDILGKITCVIKMLNYLAGIRSLTAMNVRAVLTANVKATEAKLWVVTTELNCPVPTLGIAGPTPDYSLVDAVLTSVKSLIIEALVLANTLPACKAANMTITRLEEAKMWIETVR